MVDRLTKCVWTMGISQTRKRRRKISGKPKVKKTIYNSEGFKQLY